MTRSRIVAWAALMAVLLGVAPGAVVAGEEEPVELDRITVKGIDEALVLRAIQVALNTERSSKAEDLDKMVCWFDKRTGSHLTFLYCSTNRILEKSRQYLQSGGSPADFDDILAYRVDRGALERNLASLGPVSVNREIVHRTLAGEPLPENLPGQTELDGFIRAFAEVRAIGERFDPEIRAASGADREALINESDGLMMAAIQASGLSVDRYNEISGLVTRYGSLRDYVRQRIAD